MVETLQSCCEGRPSLLTEQLYYWLLIIDLGRNPPPPPTPNGGERRPTVARQSARSCLSLSGEKLAPTYRLSRPPAALSAPSIYRDRPTAC